MDRRGRARILGRRILSPAATWLAALGLAIVVLACLQTPTYAQERRPDQACILCHGDTEQVLTLPSGEVLELRVDLTELAESLHGTHAAAPIYCTDCHRTAERYRYPHEPNPAQTLHEFSAEVSQNCSNCHTPIELHNPGHLQATGNPNLPTCADCHGGHDVVAMDPTVSPVALCQTCHQTYDDPRVQDVHEQLVANFGPGQDCQVCHGEMQQPVDAKCQTCHEMLDSVLVLESGQTLNLHVNPQDIIGSVHGTRTIQGVRFEAMQCTDCHVDQGRYGFPHPPLTETTLRGVTIEMERICSSCHTEIYEKEHDGVHAQAILSGNLEAATCADCHGNHDIQDPDEPRQRVSETCAQCHASIAEEYNLSVHGAALLGEDNPDVPVCTDCHGVHDINNPTTNEFRANSPTLCAGCHANEEMMGKYGISTAVFSTYVADFHGTTATLFEKSDPNHQINTAVCYDCHGVHNILPATDENSMVLKANLLATCQTCHPDANENFPDSWMSHFEPSPENNPLVYYINLFYAILIPAVVGGFALFIGSDVIRRMVDRFRSRRKHEEHDDAQDSAPGSAQSGAQDDEEEKSA